MIILAFRIEILRLLY